MRIVKKVPFFVFGFGFCVCSVFFWEQRRKQSRGGLGKIGSVVCECVRESGVGTCEWGFYSGRFWGLGNENDRGFGLVLLPCHHSFVCFCCNVMG